MNLIVVDGDQARLYGTPKTIPQGQSQFSQVQFSFSEEWTNLRKVAQFEQKGNIYNVEVSDDRCFCPSELVKGGVKVRVKGYPGDTTSAVIATANEIVLFVSVGFQSGGIPPVPPTPDLYQKLIGEFSDKVQPDWGQNDSTAKDYVKNRTHWVDDDGTVHKLDKKFLPDSSAVSFAAQTLTDAQKSQARENIGAQEWICGSKETPEETIANFVVRSGQFSSNFSFSKPLEVGKTYKVYNNDSFIESTASEFNGNIQLSITNGVIMHPIGKPEEGFYNGAPTNFGEYSITIPAHTEIVQIPEKYIPSDNFKVTLIQTGATSFTSDKTYAQIAEAVKLGKRVYLDSPNEGVQCYTYYQFISDKKFFFYFLDRFPVSGQNNDSLHLMGYLLDEGGIAEKNYIIDLATPETNKKRFLPSVTASDNGKILKVVDGAWVMDMPSGGTDISLGLTSSTIGQIAKIASVDADGKPTAWEPVDMPNGGGSTWVKVYDGSSTIAEEISVFEVDLTKSDPMKEFQLWLKLDQNMAADWGAAKNISVTVNGETIGYFFFLHRLNTHVEFYEERSLEAMTVVKRCMSVVNLGYNVTSPMWMVEQGVMRQNNGKLSIYFPAPYAGKITAKVYGRY